MPWKLAECIQTGMSSGFGDKVDMVELLDSKKYGTDGIITRAFVVMDNNLYKVILMSRTINCTAPPASL